MANARAILTRAARGILCRSFVFTQQRAQQRGAIFIAVAGQTIGVATHEQGEGEANRDEPTG